MADFKKLGLADWVVRQTGEMGLKHPTPVQEHCIPQILEGRDCIGCAKTGSGKTAAFALPILQKLSEDPYGIFALVITPTRELACQIADQFRVFGLHIGLKDAVIIGGLDMMKQSLELSKNPHVVIATPGRLADHLRSTDTLSFRRLRFLVLDEADRLLDKSFEEDLEVIFEALPSKRQTLFFSATLTDTLSRLKEKAVNQPFFWEAPSQEATVEQLDQRYILTPAKVKDCYLVSLLEQLHTEDKKTIIIFTPTCRICHVCGLLLRELGYLCTALHSLVSQGQRLASLAQFKSGQVKILVATDVASRGLDIPAVQVVINYNVPATHKDYIHRVGRTARAGKGGMSVTMVTQHDVERVKNIELHTRKEMTEFKMEEHKVLQQLNTVTIARKEVELRLSETNFGEKRKINEHKMKLLKRLGAKKRLNVQKGT